MPGLGQAVLAGMELPDVARQGAEMRPLVVAPGGPKRAVPPSTPSWYRESGAVTEGPLGKTLLAEGGLMDRELRWGGALCSVQTPLSLAFSSVPCGDVLGFPPQPSAGFLTVPALSQTLLALTQPTRTAQHSSFCLQVFVFFFKFFMFITKCTYGRLPVPYS